MYILIERSHWLRIGFFINPGTILTGYFENHGNWGPGNWGLAVSIKNPSLTLLLKKNMLEKVLQKEDGHEKTPKDQKKPVSIILELSKKMFTNCSDGLNMFENFVFGVW